MCGFTPFRIKTVLSAICEVTPWAGGGTPFVKASIKHDSFPSKIGASLLCYLNQSAFSSY